MTSGRNQVGARPPLLLCSPSSRWLCVCGCYCSTSARHRSACRWSPPRASTLGSPPPRGAPSVGRIQSRPRERVSRGSGGGPRPPQHRHRLPREHPVTWVLVGSMSDRPLLFCGRRWRGERARRAIFPFHAGGGGGAPSRPRGLALRADDPGAARGALSRTVAAPPRRRGAATASRWAARRAAAPPRPGDWVHSPGAPSTAAVVGGIFRP